MGQLTNLYVSESYQGLLKLANSTTGVTGTLQYVQDGLGNNIPMLVSTSSVVITGSFRGDGSGLTGITATVDSGSLVTTASFNAYTSSNDNKVNSLIASTGSYATTSSLTSLSQSIASTDLAQNNRLTAIEGVTGSFASTASLNSYTLTSSFNAYTSSTNGRLSSLESVTASLQNQINQKLDTGSFNAYTSSNDTKVNDLISKTGSYVTETESGSFMITGSVSGPTSTFTKGNGSQFSLTVNNVQSASHAINADTASFFNGIIASASFATNAATASIANDLIVRGKNNNSSTLTRGTIVRIIGANGDNPLIDSASWSDDFNSANTLGMLSEDVVSNGFANVVVQGKVIGINTTNMSAGSLLFLSSSGQYTTSSVPPPYHEVRLGQVLRDNTNNGSAYITIDNGYELTELHDVDITSPVDGDLLVYRSGSYGIWQNETGAEIGLATTSSVNQKLDTGSFNTYTASMDARTGSYAITGSNTFIGNQIINGSVDVRSGSLDLLSSTSPNIDLYLTNSVNTQANIIKGWGDNFAQGGPGSALANYTGSIRITGSNNMVSLPQLRATAVGGSTDLQGYISGSDNMIMGNTAGIYLNTGSLLFPKTQNNLLGNASTILMNFTTSSLAGGHPVITNNIVNGGNITLSHNSGSFTSVGTNYIGGGGITSVQNFVTNTRALITQNTVTNTVTLNHISSSITYQSNNNNAPITINNHVSSSNIANNFVSVANNIFLGGSNSTGHAIYASGSQSSNSQRFFTDNIIGGRNIIVSSSFVSSSNSNLLSSLIYGQALFVSGNHSTTNGGSAFLGRYNDATSLHLAQDIVFAVGTGTSNTNRRTGLWITSGSLVGVSGSLDVKGNALITGSVQGNVTPLTVASNTASLNLNNGNFFELALTGSQDIRIEPSNIKPGQTINIKLNTTGSGTVSFPTSVKQVSGSAYVPTTGTSTDIITMVSFDSTNLFLANVKNLI